MLNSPINAIPAWVFAKNDWVRDLCLAEDVQQEAIVHALEDRGEVAPEHGDYCYALAVVGRSYHVRSFVAPEHAQHSMADRAAPDDLDEEPAGDQTSALADSVVGLSYAQLAQRMGCSKTTAWERVHKAAQAANSGQLELI